MAAITILLVLGICVFLIWFFETVMNDCSSAEDCEFVEIPLELAKQEYSRRR